MAINNPWLTPFQRSYQDIRTGLIEKLKLRVPEITDYSEGNILVIIISMFAAIAEVLHYYIDSMARESFFITARRYSSLVKYTKMVDYHIISAVPATANVLLYRSSGQPCPVDVSIPSGALFVSGEGLKYITNKPVRWLKGTYSLSVSVTQIEYTDEIEIGLVPSENVYITMGELGVNNFYAEGTMSLRLLNDGISTTWLLVDTFAYSRPTSQHFKVEVNSDQKPVIIFGDGIRGSKPTVGSIIYARYGITRGKAGNIPVNSLKTPPQEVLELVADASCTNKLSAVGGSDYEDFNMIKQHLPLSLKTLGSAITATDFADLAKMAPGVDKAYSNFVCGHTIDVYITPDSGGTATEALTDSVRYFLLSKKILGNAVNVHPARETLIYISASIVGKQSYRSADIYNQVIASLTNSYNYNNSDIGKPIRLSELYSQLENLSMVDYLIIDNLYLKPVVTPMNDSIDLNFEVKITKMPITTSYILRYTESNGVGVFSILGTSGLPTSKQIPYTANSPTWDNVTLDDADWDIRISPNESFNYINGSMWTITLLQNSVDQVPLDMVIPLFKSESQATLLITERA